MIMLLTIMKERLAEAVSSHLLPLFSSSLEDEADDVVWRIIQELTKLMVGIAVLILVAAFLVYLLIQDGLVEEAQQAEVTITALFKQQQQQDQYMKKHLPPSLDSMLLLLHEWSRGLTLFVDPQLVHLWRQACNDDPCLLRVVCGALWFRFHVGGQQDAVYELTEYMRSQSSQSQSLLVVDDDQQHQGCSSILTCLGLVQWALGPCYFESIITSVFEALTILTESKCLFVPVTVMDVLLEEVLRSDKSWKKKRKQQCEVGNFLLLGNHQNVVAAAKRLRSHLALLHVIRIEAGRVYLVPNAIHTVVAPKAAPQSTTTSVSSPPLWPSPFVRRLNNRDSSSNSSYHVPNSPPAVFCSLHLVHFCLQLRYWKGAERLLQNERIASGRLTQLGIPHAVNSWYTDLANLQTCLEQSLIPVPVNFRSSSCRVMATCVLQMLLQKQQQSPQPHNNSNGSYNTHSVLLQPLCRDGSYETAHALHRLGTSLLPFDPELGLDCLELANATLIPLLEQAVDDVQAEFQYLGSTYWSLGLKNKAWQCFEARSSFTRSDNDNNCHNGGAGGSVGVAGGSGGCDGGGYSSSNPWALLNVLSALGSAFFSGLDYEYDNEDDKYQREKNHDGMFTSSSPSWSGGTCDIYRSLNRLRNEIELIGRICWYLAQTIGELNVGSPHAVQLAAELLTVCLACRVTLAPYRRCLTNNVPA